jgi:polyferredoxin
MPRARTALMVAIVVGVLCALAVLVWLIAELRLLMDKSRVPTREDLERAALAFKTLSVVMSCAVLGAATWIGHFAWRIHREEVYPPPGSRHLRVKRVRRGKEARRVAWYCYALAVLLIAGALAIAPVAFHMMRTLPL